MPYLAPKTREEAFTFLESRNARILAGGTDFFPALESARLPARSGDGGAARAEHILDITGIEGLAGISREADGGWRIGAASTWTQIINAPLPPGFDALKAAAAEVGSIQIQNRGTVAGNICNASPAADGVPPLLVLDAEVEIACVRGVRVVRLDEFITGARKKNLGDGEIVTAILIPPIGDGANSAFVKLGSRKYLVISIAMAAAVAEIGDGVVRDVRIAVGSCSAVAQRLPALENHLMGREVASFTDMDFADEKFYAPLTPISDIRGSSAYRAEVVGEICRRAVMQICGEGGHHHG